MVKRQKEKQYQSATENRANSQLRAGRTSSAGSNDGSQQRKLPFHCCALTLLPFTTPVCNKNGIIFEKNAIETFLKEHNNIDPVTGEKMNPITDLIILNMDKNDEGKWQCPIITKPFADHAKIIAIKQQQQPRSNKQQEANVYSYEAYQELNIKAKNYEDLISGQKFHKTRDVIILNDPSPTSELSKLRDINTFFHITNQRQLQDTKMSAGTTAGNNNNNNIRHSVTATRILEKLNKDQENSNTTTTTIASKKRQQQQEEKQQKDNKNKSSNFLKEGKRLKIFSDDVHGGTKLTAGKASGSLTSTVMDVTYDNEIREATDEEILKSIFQLMKQRKQKGYIKMITNIGSILIELHCDIVPRTTTNFIQLCENKKYNGTSFHRLIPNFMIQGGKPSKDASSDETDECIWGGSFKDEFDNRLQHNGSGIISMANAGPNTNRRQFFFTFKSCEHLNKKHSVFGVVVGEEGLHVLKKMEKIPTDKKDRPLDSIVIVDTIVVENPFKEAEKAEMRRIEKKQQQQKEKHRNSISSSAFGQKEKSKQSAANNTVTTDSKPQIGKYLTKKTVMALPEDASGVGVLDLKTAAKPMATSGQKKAPTKSKFGNFSGW